MATTGTPIYNCVIMEGPAESLPPFDMKQVSFLLCIFLAIATCEDVQNEAARPKRGFELESGGSDEGGHGFEYNGHDFGGGYGGGYGGGFGHLHQEPQVHEVTKFFPVHKELRVPVHHPVHHPINIPVPVKVPEPYHIKIPVPVQVEKVVEVPVEKIVEYPVEKLVPYKVVKKVPFPVEKPYPVPVPVYKLRLVHHTKKVYKSHHPW